MRLIFDLPGGLALAVADPGPSAMGRGAEPADLVYPTASLQRGLLLVDGSRELSGEGVGFGVPVLKRGARAVFAGDAELTRDRRRPDTITLTYLMDRAERLGGRRRASPPLIPLDLLRELFALLYRRAPLLRRFLMAWSNGVRWVLRVRTRFEPIAPVARIPVTYTLTRDGGLRITVGLDDLPPEVTEIVVMNELGATCFDIYTESGGHAEEGRRIGAWDLVRGESAAFGTSVDGVWFGLDRDPDPGAPHARLYHGREQARGRLAWAGFGYSLRPGPATFTYTLRIGRDATREDDP